MEYVLSDPHYEVVRCKTLVATVTLRTKPDKIFLAVRFSFSDETGAILIKKYIAVIAFEAGCMPFQVGCHAQDKLICNWAVATSTH